jgi:hypothetical protein
MGREVPVLYYPPLGNLLQEQTQPYLLVESSGSTMRLFGDIMAVFCVVSFIHRKPSHHCPANKNNNNKKYE